MKPGKWLIIIAVALLILAACSINSNSKDRVKMDFPKWWDTQGDQDYFFSYGLSTKASQTLSIEAARANALSETSRYVKSEVSSMVRTYEQEAGVEDPQLLSFAENVIEVVSNTNFSGIITGATEVYRDKIDEDVRYTTYIQMKLPKKEISLKLIENIRNEEALYNEFKASQSFRELERKVGY